MTNKPFPLAASVFAAALLATAAVAQTATAQPATDAAGSPAAQIEKPSPYPSPYQGVSRPPADDSITVSDEPATQPAPAAKPAPEPAHRTAAAAPPSPELGAADEDDQDQPAAPVLKSRSETASGYAASSEADGIVTYVPGPANALPEGTVFRVRMQQEIFAETAMPGTPFRARLLDDLKHDGRIVVPAGSELRGRIVRASTGRRITGSSIIHLRPEEFILPDGTRYRLDAEVIDTQGSNTKASGEGNIVPKSGAGRTLADLAVTSGGGAIVGASLGGPVGAAVGSAVGAGIVTGDWLFENRSADISEQSTVIFSLTDPMFLSPVHD